METIAVETLRQWLEEGRPVTVLDIRPAEQRAEWAIAGSIHLDAYRALNEHDPHALDAFEGADDTPIVTVCAAGKTSQLAAAQLAARGLPAYSLEGGMKAWSLAWNTAEIALEEQEVRVMQIRRTGKGCLSYLIGAGSEAFVIDASLDPQVYLNLAKSQGWQITHVFDTHIHADHLSRARQLAERSGATLLLPDQQRVSFPATLLRNDDTVTTAHLRLTALRTPGHTPESTCYLLNNAILFTGDTLFPSSVGRPDLHANVQEAQARSLQLYQSLHMLGTLPSEVLVLPGHASQPVPFDGQPIGARLAEIEARVDLLHEPQDVFIETLLQRLPPTPPNYERIIALNEAGLFPDQDVTELEAGANRCAIS